MTNRSDKLSIYVSPRDAGQRLDRFLQLALAPLSRNRIKQALDMGQVRLHGRLDRQAGRIVRAGELLEVHFVGPGRPPPELEPERLRCFDRQLLAVDKPAGLNMHAVEKGDICHLVAAVQAWAAAADEPLEPGAPFIASRLDRETSGLVVFGWTREAGRRLTEQFSSREVGKRYLAVVHGQPPDEGEIEVPIDAVGNGRHGVRPTGKPARTRFRVLSRGREEAALEVFPETGRTHQIRVHLASIGHPLVGDLLYGGHWREGATRCLLHAERLELEHPKTGERLELCAPVPPELLPR